MDHPLNRDFPPIFDGHEDFITQVKRRGQRNVTIGPTQDRDLLADGGAPGSTEHGGQGHVDL
ncbi:MAG: hypothetical protein ACRDG3_02840, partial [Tepidiformaceae bacterium]